MWVKPPRASLATLRGVRIHFVKPGWDEICSVRDLELNRSIPKGDKMFEREVPDIFPIFSV